MGQEPLKNASRHACQTSLPWAGNAALAAASDPPASPARLLVRPGQGTGRAAALGRLRRLPTRDAGAGSCVASAVQPAWHRLNAPCQACWPQERWRASLKITLRLAHGSSSLCIARAAARVRRCTSTGARDWDAGEASALTRLRVGLSIRLLAESGTYGACGTSYAASHTRHAPRSGRSQLGHTLNSSHARHGRRMLSALTCAHSACTKARHMPLAVRLWRTCFTVPATAPATVPVAEARPRPIVCALRVAALPSPPSILRGRQRTAGVGTHSGSSASFACPGPLQSGSLRHGAAKQAVAPAPCPRASPRRLPAAAGNSPHPEVDARGVRCCGDVSS